MGEGERLYHSYRAGKRKEWAFADDYAAMIRASLVLHEATADKKYLDQAKIWTETLNREFWDDAAGGYAFSREKGGPITLHVRSAADTHAPSSNGLMVGSLARLYFSTGDQQYADRAENILRVFAGDLATSYLQMGAFMNGFEYIATGLQVVIVGPRNDARTTDLVEAVLSRSLPNRLLIVVEPGENLPLGHPAFGKSMQGGAPAAYVCQQSACSAPMTSPVALAQSLILPAPRQAPGQTA